MSRRLPILVSLAILSVLPASAAHPEGASDPSGRARLRPGTERNLRLELRRNPPPMHRSSRAEAREAAAPANEGGFLAISGQETPSDTTGAVGDTHAVTAVNVDYAVYPKAVTSPSAPLTPLVAGRLASLFPNLASGRFFFDPKVVYDHYTGRHVLIFLGDKGRKQLDSRIFIVAIPDATASNPGTWCKRVVKGDQIKKDGRQSADYPGLGFDRNNLFITTNQFSVGRGGILAFQYAQILVIGKQSLYGCQGKLKTAAFGGAETRNPGGSPAFTIMPAVTQSETGQGDAEFLVNFQESSCGPICGKRLTVWRIARKGRRITLARDQVNVPKGRFPPPGTQRDGSPTCNPIEHCWEVGDLRLVTAFYDADRGFLYTAHTVAYDVAAGDGYVEAAVRWYEIAPAPIRKTRVTRTGILGDSGRDSGWPSVSTDGNGTLFVTYSRGGAPPPGEYISAIAATIPPGALAPDALTVLAPGEALYVSIPGRPQRWGDYSATNRDPVDPLDVWLVNQYARSDGTPPTTNLWQQTVNRVSHA